MSPIKEYVHGSSIQPRGTNINNKYNKTLDNNKSKEKSKKNKNPTKIASPQHYPTKTNIISINPDYLSDFTPTQSTTTSDPHTSHSIPVRRSTHPLDMSITPTDATRVQSLYQSDPNQPLTTYNNRKIGYLITQNILDLITHGSSINDEIIHQYLSIICHTLPGTYQLDTNFSRDLPSKGWRYAYNKYFLTDNSSRLAHRTKTKPLLKDSPLIMIPIHVHGFHWVALTRRQINGRIYFLYSDDMNSPNTHDTIKTQYSTEFTDPNFNPPDSIWINCTSNTYLPHSNECGPRTLLALTLMATHQLPHENMLLPIMHPNIAQITRWWIAKTILTQQIDLTPLSTFTSITQIEDTRTSHNATSEPYDLYDLSGKSKPPSPSHTEEAKPNVCTQQMVAPMPLPSQKVHTQNTTTPSPITSTNGPDDPPTHNQSSILQWTTHRPFIPGVLLGPNKNQSINTDPLNPNEDHSAHTKPYGTPLPLIDPSKTLRVVMQNPQHSFRLHNNNIELLQMIENVKTLDAGLLAVISPNANWCNTSNWATAKNIFRKSYQQVHLSAISSNIGKDREYLHNPILVGGSAIFAFDKWASKVSNTMQDTSGYGTYTITSIQGKNGKIVSIIAAYIAVNKGSNHGIDSLYAQQQTLSPYG
jgi:hypothetical protein